MAGYKADKTYTQIGHAIQDRVGNVIRTAQLVLKHLDGTTADPANIKGDIIGALGGANPTYSDDDGYVPPFYKHGDYIAQWTAHGDTTQRVIRVPPIFEDFGMVDVTKYSGVDPSGATDSKAGIEAAIIDTAGKFKLFFPPGSYRLDSRINARPGMHLVGCGRMSRIWAGAANTQLIMGHPTIAGSLAPDDVTIEHLWFDGNRSGRSAATDSLLKLGYGGLGGNNLTFRFNWITESPTTSSSLWLDSIVNPKIYGNIIGWGGQDGITTIGLTRGVFANNFIYDSSDDGISFWGNDHCILIGNFIIRPPGTPNAGRCFVLGDADRCVVSGNYMDGGERGNIEINTNAAFNEITGNVLVNAGNRSGTSQWGNGIHYIIPGNFGQGSPDPNYHAEHNNIVGNVIMNPRRHGVLLECESPSTVYHLQHSNVSENIMISDGVGNASFKAGDGCGIHASHSASNVSKIEHMKLAGNMIYGFDAEGIILTGIPSNRITGIDIANNEIYNCGTQASFDSDAIKLDYVSNFKTRNNTGVDTQSGLTSQKGIYIANPQGVAVLSGNDMVGCKTYKVSLNNWEDAANPVIRDNPGFSPWAGKAAVPAGTGWSAVGNGVYKRVIFITFGAPISVAATPKITANAEQDGWFVTVNNILSAGFSANIFSVTGDPGSGASGTIHWQVEV